MGQHIPPPTPEGQLIENLLPGIEQAVSFIPVVGPIASAIIDMFSGAFGNLGRGRTEADEIVPTQNQLMAYLGQITNQLTAQPPPNVPQLQAYLYLVEQVGNGFKTFVSNSRFIDGRASQQALNTVMPYVDGTTGYHWPPPMAPTQTGVLTWGDGTPGGPGTNGMVGAIQRAILLLGGQPTPVPPTVVNGLNTVPSLTSMLPGAPNIPQAGSLLPNTPGVTAGQPLTSGWLSSDVFDPSTLVPVGVGLLWLFALRSRMEGAN
jgi:hypothetical protein